MGFSLNYDHNASIYTQTRQIWQSPKLDPTASPTKKKSISKTIQKVILGVSLMF